MRFIFCLIMLFTALPALTQVNKELQNQLVKMLEQNQQIRQSLEKYAVRNVPPTLQSVASQIDNLHTQILKEIIALHGWPTKKQVGEQGIHATFILALHCNDLAFQQDMLPLIIQSYLDQDGIAGKDVAQFTDIVSIKLGKKQVFGTQANWLNGKVKFLPIENEENVDVLRAQLGMSSLADYKKSLEISNK